ncbi:hypothetical protein [Streptomyces jumonjinensis]|uniref:Adenylate/guanylate cyclase domain-containing protein n=1 Tax=Streptomyces jumonjinensis TaxID=1945 RepID=A0A646KPQ9_STRJU|nr:hypothetical protein [Streptomyces jumonjinensis]MQT04047.1 hypothetical protein [Streptomyces jumonjinensis]
MTEPVSRTILLLDIERYSDRDDVEQAYLRRMLYDVTDQVLESAGIDETRRLRADRGDSVMELIDANASLTALLRAVISEVPVQLRAVNRMASKSAQIRLRGVVATGYVAVDGQGGWVGSDLNHACRLLDAQLLRDALRERADDFALCVAEGVHSGIVRHDHKGIPRDAFHPITVDSKNGPLRAWLYGPVPGSGGTDRGDTDHHGEGEAPAPGGSGDRPAPARGSGGGGGGGGVTFAFHGGAPSFGGSLVAGDQHGVSGGQVTGDVHLGGVSGGTGNSGGTASDSAQEGRR